MPLSGDVTGPGIPFMLGVVQNTLSCDYYSHSPAQCGNMDRSNSHGHRLTPFASLHIRPAAPWSLLCEHGVGHQGCSDRSCLPFVLRDRQSTTELPVVPIRESLFMGPGIWSCAHGPRGACGQTVWLPQMGISSLIPPPIPNSSQRLNQGVSLSLVSGLLSSPHFAFPFL